MRYTIEILRNGYTRVYDRESQLSALYHTDSGKYYTGDLHANSIEDVKRTNNYVVCKGY